MKLDPHELQPLLDDLLPESQDAFGPDHAAVVQMLRKEKRRRRIARGTLGLTALGIAGLLLLKLEPINQPKPGPVEEAPRIAIKPVNDDQFLNLLRDTPVALVEWPNGERTLLVVNDREGSWN